MMSPARKQPDMSTYSGRFAARLRELREKAGLSVEQMVEGIAEQGFSVALRTYYGWESGTREPPLDAFPAIASTLSIKIRNLLPLD